MEVNGKQPAFATLSYRARTHSLSGLINIYFISHILCMHFFVASIIRLVLRAGRRLCQRASENKREREREAENSGGKDGGSAVARS